MFGWHGRIAMFSNEGDVKAAFTPQSMKLEKTLSLEEINHIFLDFYANYILKKKQKNKSRGHPLIS